MGVVVRQPVISAASAFKPPSSHTFNPLSQSRSMTAAQVAMENRFPLALETPPAHAGLMGLLYPWGGDSGGASNAGPQDGFTSGLSMKVGMVNWKHSATFICIPRDRTQKSNRISIDSDGNPVIHYEVCLCIIAPVLLLHILYISHYSFHLS